MIWYDALKEIKAIVDSDLDAVAADVEAGEAVAIAPAAPGGLAVSPRPVGAGETP